MRPSGLLALLCGIAIGKASLVHAVRWAAALKIRFVRRVAATRAALGEFLIEGKAGWLRGMRGTQPEVVDMTGGVVLVQRNLSYGATPRL